MQFFTTVIFAVLATTHQVWANDAEQDTNPAGLRGDAAADRELWSPSGGCCSWGEFQNYCGSPPGDVDNWCSKSEHRCLYDHGCKSNGAKWLPTCETLELPGVCVEKHHPYAEKDCWCSISRYNCHGCDGSWSTGSGTTAPPHTTHPVTTHPATSDPGTAEPGTTHPVTDPPANCYSCSAHGDYRHDCPVGFHAPCDDDNHRYIECIPDGRCYDRPCSPGTSRKHGTCPGGHHY